MLIAIDIGNTRITIGYFTIKGLIVQNIETIKRYKVNDYLQYLNDFFEKNHIEKSILHVIISSVVSRTEGNLLKALRRLSEKRFSKLIVSPKLNTGLSFRIENPDSLGSDRIVNAVAALNIYGTDVAVVDFGTATTISVVTGNGIFIGGSIMPGIRLMNEILGKRTSQLKEVDLFIPEKALGNNASECIRSGLYYGTAGAVEKIIEEIEIQEKLALKTVLTGGFASSMHSFVRRSHELRPMLTLEGLKILHERNSVPENKSSQKRETQRL